MMQKIAGLAKIAYAIKSKGSKALLQIYHGGRMVDPKLIVGRTPVGPSAVAAPRDGAATPVALTAEEVEAMIAKLAKRAPTATRRVRRRRNPRGEHLSHPAVLSRRTLTSATTSGGGSRANTARVSRWRRWTSPTRWRASTLTVARFYRSATASLPEELEVPGIRFDDTLYLLEKLAARGVDYRHFSVGADPASLYRRYSATRRR